jgi:hypothetical protein
MRKLLAIGLFVLAFAGMPTSAPAQDTTPPKNCEGGTTDCDWGEISDDDDQDARLRTQGPVEYEGAILEELLRPSSQRALAGSEFTLASIRGYPETKTEMVNRCVKIFGKKMCTKIPKIYKRISHLEVIGQISYPQWERIRVAAERCVREAIVAGVAAGAATGAVPAAAAAFEAYIKGCLAAAGKKNLKDLKVGLYTRKTPGPWEGI